MDANRSIVIATRRAWDREEPVMLSSADRRQHVYVIGKSGTGKTTLLRNMILQDIEAGRAVAVIDPHGDLAVEILDHLPRRDVERLTYFDPSDSEYSVGFNPLANVDPDRRHLVASGIVGAFKAVFPDYFGPRMEYIFHAAVAALLDCENVTLLSLQRMLSDDRYRRWVIKQVKDPIVRAFWEREFEPHDRKTKAEMVAPILNKVGPLLMAPQIRNILGQVRSRIDARFMMDTGRIFIANLSKGMLGADKANLLGSFLVAQFQVAAMSRADMPESERRQFFLYVDEFQSFVSESFASILSESRKYGLSVVAANQYLRQVKPTIADALTGNVGSIIAFRVGHDDAESLQKAFGNSYAAPAFTGLSNREIYAKLLVDGQDIEPFSARTLPPHGIRHGRREAIIRRSREKYASRREIIEGRIQRWLKIPKARLRGRG